VTMHVNLSPEMEGFIKTKVTSGFYANATEVIRDAIRRMQAGESRVARQVMRTSLPLATGVRPAACSLSRTSEPCQTCGPLGGGPHAERTVLLT
jgi:putative addiction module CopG family antidote